MTLSEYLKSPTGEAYTYLFSKVGFDLRAALETATKSAYKLRPESVDIDEYVNGFIFIFAPNVPIGDRIQFIESSMQTHSPADLRALYMSLPVEQRRALSAAESEVRRAIATAIESDPPNRAPIDEVAKRLRDASFQPRGAVFADAVPASQAYTGRFSRMQQGLIAGAAVGSLLLLFLTTRD